MTLEEKLNQNVQLQHSHVQCLIFFSFLEGERSDGEIPTDLYDDAPNEFNKNFMMIFA
jgi:hypothetical protein